MYTITDPRDGQSYRVVRIGEQWWMAENLNFGIRLPITDSMTNNSIVEKYCPDDSEEQCGIYGGLYFWDEQMNYGIDGTNTGICPSGWHIPTDAEWKAMELHIGMSPAEVDKLDWRGTDEGGKLKSIEPSTWLEPNACATDEFGFSALPAGWIGNKNTNSKGYGAFFYCSDQYSGLYPWLRFITTDSCKIYRRWGMKTGGQSVRCLKNEDSPFILERGQLEDYRDGKVYQTVLIGNHWWMAENLNHGTWIDLIGQQTDNEVIQKYCYNNRGEYCDTFGGLYRWDEMMNYDPYSRQGICPEGWHIPSDNDWKELEFAAGMIEADLNKTGWERGTFQGLFLQGGGGSGFEALPGGMIDPHGNSGLVDTSAFIWTSDTLDEKYSWSRVFQSGKPTLYRNDRSNQHDALSVRCVSNKNEILTLNLLAAEIVCAGEEFELMARVQGGSANKEYSWTSDPPGIYPNDSIISVQAQEDTKYWVRVIDGHVYTRDSFTVRVNPAPVFTVTGENIVCASAESIVNYSVTDSPDFSYFWSPMDGEIVSGSNANIVSVKWETPGTKAVSVEVTNKHTGCADRKSYEIEVLPVPSKPGIRHKGEHLLICPDSGRIYQWYQNDAALEGANKQFYYAKSNKTGSFRVETRLGNQCTSISDPVSFSGKSTGGSGDELQNVFIRPNPSRGNIIMDIINDYYGPIDISIFNSMGTIIRQYNLFKQSQVFESGFDLGGLDEGLFFLIVDYGLNKEVHKLTIKH